MKKILLILSLFSAITSTYLLESCSNDNADELRDIEITFTDETAAQRLPIEVLQRLADDPTVRKIYMIPDGNWRGYGPNAINGIRVFFQPRIEISSKIQGRGNFIFDIGKASPEDSLWFVQHGWTINKNLNEK